MASRNKIILASASPRRKEILESLGIDFSAVSPSIEETSFHKRPSFIVRDIAAQKASSVAARLNDKNAIIISADTIVVCRGEIIGKPSTRAAAARILKKLSGTTHKVYTGVAVLDVAKNRLLLDYEVSKIKMRRLSAGEITSVAGKHLDKAGAYAIQEKNDAFVEKIDGDYFNVVGLPVKILTAMLKKAGVAIRRR